MATDLRSLPAFLGDDATFRTWGSGISAQFAAMGLVQTADTGQINWATVLRPATLTVAGYEIWRFADALQATKPVFIKIEYRIGSVADRPSLILSVGTGSNGAGTLTGQLGAPYTLFATASKAAAGATLPSYCSGSTSRLSMVTNLESAGSAFSFTLLIERPRDSSGVEGGECIVTFFAYGGTNAQYQLIPFTGTIPAAYVTGGLPAVNLTSTGAMNAVGNNVPLVPMIIVAGVVKTASFLSYLHAEIGELATISATHMGAVHTFMPIGDGGPGTKMNQSNVGASALAILWE